MHSPEDFAAVREKLTSLVRHWRSTSDLLNSDRIRLERGRFFTSLTPEEQRQWTALRDEAGALRACATALEGIIGPVGVKQ